VVEGDWCGVPWEEFVLEDKGFPVWGIDGGAVGIAQQGKKGGPSPFPVSCTFTPTEQNYNIYE
jgi:hypothetical protein